MPAAGHMVHMPAHIYIRVGRYADAAEANVRAIAADEDYLSQCQAQGLYPVSYYPHNLHFLWAAATLEGRSAVAIDAARQLAAKVPHHHAGALAWTADFPVTPLAGVRPVRQVAGDAHRAEAAGDASPTPRASGTTPVRSRSSRASGSTRADEELAALKAMMDSRAFKTTLKDLPLLTNLQIASRIVERRARGSARGRRTRRSNARGSGHDRGCDSVQRAACLASAAPAGAGRAAAGSRTAARGRSMYRKDLERFRENGWSLFGLWRASSAQGAIGGSDAPSACGSRRPGRAPTSR